MSDESRTSKIPDTDREGGSAEQAIIDARRMKAGRIRARGENPFANDVVPRAGGATLDVAAARAVAMSARDAAGKYDDAKVRELAGGRVLHVRGRVIALRSTGGLSFLKVRDRTGEIQLLVSESVLGAD
jgi:lysyl-tRNA synthetase, class II